MDKRALTSRFLACKLVLVLLAGLSLPGCTDSDSKPTNLPVPKPTVIKLDMIRPADADDSAGGLTVADVNDDGLVDYLVTMPGRLVVHDNNGSKLWAIDADIVVSGQSETYGLPGHHGPGVAAGDVDGDGACEVIFLSRDGLLLICNGATGKTEATAKLPVPEGAERWELAMIADLRGKGGDRDIILQATNTGDYRIGKFMAAYAYEDLIAGKQPLWQTDSFDPCYHNGARPADIDGDGRDEVVGRVILNEDGSVLTHALHSRSHGDAIAIADVRPDLPGLEVVMPEEGVNHIQLISVAGPVWRVHYKHEEPQNIAVGRFNPESDALYIWCRSRFKTHQKPFVFDAYGALVTEYEMDDVKPHGWTDSGVEVIHTIDWTGQSTQLACAKERHEAGDVALFEPLTGRFVLHIPEQADRLYVADVSGDWREEIIVLSHLSTGSELHIYTNPAENPQPDRPSLWQDRNYRRLKQCHNYYSP